MSPECKSQARKVVIILSEKGSVSDTVLSILIKNWFYLLVCEKSSRNIVVTRFLLVLGVIGMI